MIKKFLNARRDIDAQMLSKVLYLDSYESGNTTVVLEFKGEKKKTLVIEYFQGCIDACHTQYGTMARYIKLIPAYIYAEFRDYEKGGGAI